MFITGIYIAEMITTYFFIEFDTTEVQTAKTQQLNSITVKLVYASFLTLNRAIFGIYNAIYSFQLTVSIMKTKIVSRMIN